MRRLAAKPQPVTRPLRPQTSWIATMAAARSIRDKQMDFFQRLRGDLQMHTTWSDGSASIQEMAEAAVGRGYSYIAITDHAKGLKIAGGIDEHRLIRQAAEIADVN